MQLAKLFEIKIKCVLPFKAGSQLPHVAYDLNIHVSVFFSFVFGLEELKSSLVLYLLFLVCVCGCVVVCVFVFVFVLWLF